MSKGMEGCQPVVFGDPREVFLAGECAGVGGVWSKERGNWKGLLGPHPWAPPPTASQGSVGGGRIPLGMRGRSEGTLQTQAAGTATCSARFRTTSLLLLLSPAAVGTAGSARLNALVCSPAWPTSLGYCWTGSSQSRRELSCLPMEVCCFLSLLGAFKALNLTSGLQGLGFHSPMHSLL